VAYKVIACIRTPDHSTIAELRRRHEAEIAELVDDVLGLCREPRLVSVGVITIDGTKIKANASMDQNRLYREVVGQILREDEEIDQREDELYGERRGDELPEQLRPPEGRRRAMAKAKRRLAERKGRKVSAGEPPAEPAVDPEVVLGRDVLRRGGRREWFRFARRELQEQRAREGRPIPRDREERLFQALGRHEHYRMDLARERGLRALARDGTGHEGSRAEGNSKPFLPPELPGGTINLSDPDSRVMRTQGTPPRQADNAQTAVNDPQIIVAAEITVDAAALGLWSRCSIRRFGTSSATASASYRRCCPVMPGY
jgi:hypothetical protein